MQEQLDLDEQRYMDTISTPPVSVSMLGSTAGFLDRLDGFNSRNGTDLEVQESGRWQQGTYPKFKELVKRISHPNLDKSRTIKTIFRTDHYNVGNVANELIRLDTQLKDIRTQGIKFFQDEDVEGQLALDTLMDNINQSIVDNLDIVVDVSRTPWFNKAYCHGSRGYSHKPSLPSMDRNGNILKHHLDPRDEEDTDNPKDWFINIAIPLKDVVVNVSVDDEKVIHSYDYGDLVVCQTVSIKDAVIITRRVQNDTARHMRIEDLFSGFTQKMPKYSGLHHPFVSSSSQGRSMIEQSTSYATGNTCFGSFQPQILSMLASGKITPAIPILRRWAEYYPKNNISPLNRYYYSMFGKPWSLGEAEWRVHPSLCETQVREHENEISKQDFMETFCSDCQKITSCEVNQAWTQIPIEFKLDGDEEVINWDVFILDTWLEYGNTLARRYQDLEEWENYLQNLFVLCKRQVLRGDGMRIFNEFNVNGMGAGFHTSTEFNKICEDMKNLEHFTASDFIFYFRTSEEIYYTNIKDEHELGCANDVKVIRIHHMARQRVQHVPESELTTFATRI